ncbi:MAG: hypothetical protein ACI8UO_001760, partial [Verrucomicrobiales bacterium]
GGYQEMWAGAESRNGASALQQRIGIAGANGEKFGWMTRWSTDLDSGDFDLFEELEDAVFFLRPNEQLLVTLGKQKIPFTRSIAEPNFERFAFDRPLVVNQIGPRRNFGLLAAHRGEILEWRTGVFTSAQSGEERWPAFDGGTIWYAGLTHELGHDLGELRFDALYHNDDVNSEGIDGWDRMLAASFLTEHENLRFEAEAIWGAGVEMGGETYEDVWGLAVQPSLRITDSIQWFWRYQYAFGNGGLKLYKGTILPPPGGRAFGRSWHALGTGVVVDLPKIPSSRLVAGVEWANLDRVEGRGEFDGWTVYAGFRFRL